MEEKIEFNKTYMNLEIKTWEKDSNGLFDYNSKKEIKEFSQNFDEKIDIIRKNQEIKFISGNDIESNNIGDENLLKINKEEEKYIIENDIEKNMEQNNENINKINNKLYYVINSKDNNTNNQDNQNLKNKNYYLINNDCIKLGRNKLILIETHIYSGDKKYELTANEEDCSIINKKNAESQPVFNLIKEVNFFENNNINNNSEDKIACKICYSDDIDTKNNPLIHLCKCKGDINYAHFKCIKHWMKTKLIIYENKKKTVKTYFIPRFNCEICKEPYPYRFKILGQNKIFDLIDITKPRNNYILLESLNQIKDNNFNNKYIHVISLLNEDEIIIGRGIDADIRINDISVSRSHSSLKFDFQKKNLLIKDLGSKFGTSILIRSSVELKQNENLNLQVGRSFISAHVLIKENPFDNDSLDDKEELTCEDKNENNEDEIMKKFSNDNANIINIDNKFYINLDNEINHPSNKIIGTDKNSNIDDNINQQIHHNFFDVNSGLN